MRQLKINKQRQRLSIFMGLVMLAPVASAQTPYVVEWTEQFGTSGNDLGAEITTDASGNLYVVGATTGDLAGVNAGDRDAFLAKHDTAGNVLWTRQLGGTESDVAESVAVDSSGNIYITGWTNNALGTTHYGSNDAFLSKYDAQGTLQWTRQIGTQRSDFSHGVTVDPAGDIIISGRTAGSLFTTNAGGNNGTFDTFVTKYDSDGDVVWSNQRGTSNQDYHYNIQSDAAGNTYVSGYSLATGGRSATLTKYNVAGEFQWERFVDTPFMDTGYAVAVDAAGNAYLTGATNGALEGPRLGGDDVFLVKYDSAGVLEWSRQIGTTSTEIGYSVALDADGNPYITGYTEGALEGTNEGFWDVFVTKYDTLGNFNWTQQFGTSSTDVAFGITVDGDGEVFVSGYTTGQIGDNRFSGQDAFIAKLVVPEPNSLLLLGSGGLLALRRRR